MNTENEICSYCGKKGHWRPDCPTIRARFREAAATLRRLPAGYSRVEDALPSVGVDLRATDGTTTELGFYSEVDAERHAAGGPVDEWCDFHFKVRGWAIMPETLEEIIDEL